MGCSLAGGVASGRRHDGDVSHRVAALRLHQIDDQEHRERWQNHNRRDRGGRRIVVFFQPDDDRSGAISEYRLPCCRCSERKFASKEWRCEKGLRRCHAQVLRGDREC